LSDVVVMVIASIVTHWSYFKP